MKKRIMLVLGLLLLSSPVYCYEFLGQHFFASYKECDAQALKDIPKLKQAFEHAVEASGATILDFHYFVFSEEGLTGTFILSESHASIHTYPEHNACFVDLFTCGDHCSWQQFHAILESYLQSKTVDKEIVIRS